MLWTYELVMVNYCDLHIAVTDIPLCLWNTGAPLSGNTGFICPLTRSVSTKQSGWLHNLWATSCVVNQTGYFGSLYASRHQTSLWRCQTSLWRHQHICCVQLPQMAQSLLPRPSPSFVRSFVTTALLMPQITPHSPWLQVAHSDYWVQACVAGEWRCKSNLRSLPNVQGKLADDKAITRALFCIAISAIRKCCCIALHSLEFAAQNAMRYRLSATLVVHWQYHFTVCHQVQEAGGAGTKDSREGSERDWGLGQTEAAEGWTGPNGGDVGEEEQRAHWC